VIDVYRPLFEEEEGKTSTPESWEVERTRDPPRSLVAYRDY
jgi:hypothetical protein